jgi:Ca2+-binding RTX toxin-like protein
MVNYVGDGNPNVYTGTNAADTLDGQGGADNLRGLAGHDSILGGEGNDILRGDGGRDTLLGGTENDFLIDFEDDDRDLLDGGDGNDTVYARGKDDAIGGGGTDLLILYLTNLIGVDANLSSYTPGGSISVGAITFSGFESGGIGLSEGDDRLVAPSAPFVIVGAAGNDTLIGTGGGDDLSGGRDAVNDADVLRGEGGNDSLDGGRGDRLFGGGGTDDFSLELEHFESGGSTDPFDVDFSTLPTGGVVNVGYGGALSGLETGRVFFGSGDDKAELGLADITINGGGGNDTISGGDGDDVMTGAAGNDVLRGGLGEDEARYEFADAAVVIDLNLTGWQAASGAGQDLLSAFEHLYGSHFDDRLTGNAAANRLVGESGSDTLIGGQGDDILIGYTSELAAADGDRMTGGAGRDTLTGDFGDDVMVWSSVAHTTAAAADLITNLNDGDVIHLEDIDADTTVAGNQAFTIVASLSGAAGQLARVYNGSSTEFRMDVNGDGTADGIIEASGDHAAHDDFVL